MNKTEYFAMADELAREAGVQNSFHNCFTTQRERLWKTLSHFHLWDLKGKNVLEIGTFYSYTPVVLRQNGNEVTVLEGDDPVTLPLKPLFARRGITLNFVDLAAIFGEADVAKHRLPFPDDHFDVVICWETMEHFNFNPVGFVKEVHRILKPGGTAHLTVPNRSSLKHRITMIVGRPMGEPIEGYYKFYDLPSRFFGWHWREYTPAEFRELFERAGFHIESAKCLTYFMNHPHVSYVRAACRFAAELACKLSRGLGTICAVSARK
jgi:SAM-dependent methyltransferase